MSVYSYSTWIPNWQGKVVTPPVMPQPQQQAVPVVPELPWPYEPTPEIKGKDKRQAIWDALKSVV